MMYPRGRILIFAKTPVPGKVKTRLAKGLGFDKAANLYAAMVEHTVALAVEARLAPVELHAMPDGENDFFRSLRDRFAVKVEPQVGADLGERMGNALSTALSTSDYALLIGTDCPVLDADYLEEALARLHGSTEVVLGPVEDGGYVLIGMRTMEPNLFHDINWGGSDVFEVTRRRCVGAGIDCEELRPLYDIDTEEDLRRFREELPEQAVQLIGCH